MDIVPGVKLVGHEHHFTVVIGQTPGITALRLCETCGFTCVLVLVRETWYWKPVLEAAQEGA